jgi:hypothetical protein
MTALSSPLSPRFSSPSSWIRRKSNWNTNIRWPRISLSGLSASVS